MKNEIFQSLPKTFEDQYVAVSYGTKCAWTANGKPVELNKEKIENKG